MVSDGIIITIRMDYNNNYYTIAELARDYQMTEREVYEIVTGKTHRDVGGPRTLGRCINVSKDLLSGTVAN